MKLKLRHKVVTEVLRPFFHAFTHLRYNLKIYPFVPRDGSRGPYLILSNHNSDLDPFFISLCFRFPIFFVASDHIFRWGLLSRLIRFLVSPIPKLKSQNDTRTVRDIISSLRSGASVCVFPEGDRSWCGETEEILPSIGKLAARVPAGLVLSRIRGGYLTTPRWGDKARRGRMECAPVLELLPDEIRAMGEERLTELIVRELRVSAAADQRQWKVCYSGKNLAQSIETVLYVCPACGGFATIRSSGDTAWCGCGLRFTYGCMGTLEGAPFESIHAWDLWQTGYLRGVLQQGGVDAVFSDEGQELHSFRRADRTVFEAAGRFSMYRDRFTFESGEKTEVFPFNGISDIDIWGRLTLQFTMVDGRHYEIRTKAVRSAYKYQQAFRILRGPGAGSKYV